MSDWSEGYVTDIGYTYGYYTELNPLRIQLALIESGLAVPRIETACELGFGQGMSVNIHAASSDVSWYGTDFNPAQVSFAQNLATSSGARTKLFDDSFAEFVDRDDLPGFDFIGLHGTWSWIDDKNRASLVDFIRRKLNVGGVLYISYNTMPGWTTMVPVRDLLTAHSDVMGVQGQGIVSRIDQSLAFVEKLLETKPGFARACPDVAVRLNALKGQNRQYLAHEYFNRDWLPMSFGRMAEWLAPAKLTFACSAHYHDLVDVVNLTPPQLALLADIPDLMFRQTVRDFMVNQQFRRDYWVRGARKLSPIERLEALRAQRVLLVSPRGEVSLKFAGAQGEATLQEAVCNPILDLLSDHKPRSLGEIELAFKGSAISLAHVVQAALILSGSGYLCPVQDDAVAAKVRKQTQKLNLALCDKARGSADYGTLASPVTGGGLVVGRIGQLFLIARSLGLKTPHEWVSYAWQILASQSQVLLKDGKPLKTEEENIAELTNRAQFSIDKQMPILKAGGII